MLHGALARQLPRTSNTQWGGGGKLDYVPLAPGEFFPAEWFPEQRGQSDEREDPQGDHVIPSTAMSFMAISDHFPGGEPNGTWEPNGGFFSASDPLWGGKARENRMAAGIGPAPTRRVAGWGF